MDRTSLFKEHPRRVDIPLIVLTAIVTLYFGLTQPVVLITSALYEDSLYSVIGGLVNLWQTGDAALAMLVFLFSVVFPVAKLAALVWLWFAPTVREGRRRYLRVIEPLGKWSMLDVLIVILFAGAVKLGLIADAEIRSGAYVFGAAILLSMVAAVLMGIIAGPAPRLANDPRRRSVLLPLLACAGLVLFLAGVFFPLMRVEKWVFWGENYSIITGALKLLIDGDYVMALGFFLFVVALPLILHLGQVALAVLHLVGRGGGRAVMRLLEIERWIMTDVFALALFIAVIRLSEWTRIEPRAGLYLFGAAILISPAVSFWLRCIYRRARAS